MHIACRMHECIQQQAVRPDRQTDETLPKYGSVQQTTVSGTGKYCTSTIVTSLLQIQNSKYILCYKYTRLTQTDPVTFYVTDSLTDTVHTMCM